MKKYLHNFKFFTLALGLMLTASIVNAATRTASVTGNWNNTVTWGGAAVPVAGDDVIINAGITVTTDVSTASLLSLTINGTLTIGNSNIDRSVTVTGAVTISATGTFQSAGNGGNTVIIGGNLTNGGTFDMNTAGDADVTFNGAANQTVSGTGATTDFNLVTINNTGVTNNVNNIVEITSTNFTTPADFLTLTDGTFKLSTGATLTLTGANLNLTAPDAFVVNNASAVVNIGNNDITVAGGIFELLAGTVSLGTGNDLFGVSSGTATLSGGTLNVLGQFQMTGGTTTINGATINIDPNATAQLGSTIHIFEATGAANLTFSSGSVTIIDPHSASNTGNAIQIVSGAGTKSFTGSTINLGDGVSTTAGSVDGFDVNAGVSLGSVVINNPSGTNRFVRYVTNAPTFSGNVTITTGTLNANSFSQSVSGNWVNNGTFTSGTQTTTFNGSALQTISGSQPTTFSGLTINNAAGVTVSTGAFVNGIMTFTSGVVNTNSSLITLNSASTLAGTVSNTAHIDGPVKKLGSFTATPFRFPVGDAGQYEYLEIQGSIGVAYDFTAQYKRTSATALDPTPSYVAPVINVSACDHWVLDAGTSVPIATVSLTLSWSDQFPCGGSIPYITNPATLTVAHFNGTSWDQAGTGGAGGVGSPSLGTVTRTGVSVFSPFSLGNTALDQNPLPVTFSDVKAFEKGTGVQIEWSNLTEKDVLNYVVERSSNGRDFTAISQLASRSNLSDKQSYLSFDGSPLSGTNYYRIKVVEIDGKVIYSKVLKVDIGRNVKGIILYPNPVAGSDISIGFAAVKGQYTLRVLNNAGQEVYSKQIVHPGGTISQSVTLPSALKTGVYNLMISGDNYRENKMFIMQ
jgi:G8 domain